MAVYTFSTGSRRQNQEADEMIQRLIDHCERNCLNFSAIVVKAIEEYTKAHVNG